MTDHLKCLTFEFTGWCVGKNHQSSPNIPVVSPLTFPARRNDFVFSILKSGIENINILTMAELKTKQHNADVSEFIHNFADTDQKKKDSFELLKLMQEFTGHEPKMWGPSIIGFGSYHYKSERSSQEGDWPLVGFSPRKSAISLYVFTGATEHEYLLEGLGKFTRGKGCIYVKKLSDIDTNVLKTIMKATIEFLQVCPASAGNQNQV